MTDNIYTGKKGKDRAIEIYRGEHKGFTFSIMSLGSHPTAYIKIPEGHFLYGIEYENIDISVHGGLTYSEKKKDGYWIGWDYAHAGDYMFHDLPSLSDSKGHRWIQDEIVEHCKQAIEQIPNLKKFQVEKYYYSTEKRDW